MLKQFNPKLLSFRDPAEQEIDWFDIDTQDDIDAISASITSGGTVWIEDGKIKTLR